MQGVAGKTLDKPVSIYPLQCDETFFCPSSLSTRVGFWVEVFSRWDTNTAIFHDRDNPHRVFSTISRNEGCRNSSRDNIIDRERTSLKSSLRSVADKLRDGKAFNAHEQALYSAFGTSSHQEVRAAADRIRCQSGNRDRMRTALSNFHQYRPAILDALEQNNLTLELQYLPFVESAFDPNALSHVGAAGLWQIMPATGRSLGLKVDSIVDERYDPKIASYAAAKYFRDSIDNLSEAAFENGSSVTPKNLNPFVITSYNYGVRGMERAIKQVGLDYERLLREYQSPSFQTAVKNFYASFLAARHVAKNSELFFGAIPRNNQGVTNSYNQVDLVQATSIKRLTSELNVSSDELKALNPSLNKIVWNDGALVPKNFKLKLPYRETGWDLAMTSVMSLPAEQSSGFFWYKVRSGDTACGVAERNGASCRELFQLNGLNSRGTIYVGTSIKVPGGGSSSAGTQKYQVRRGDTACSIASRHTMKCSEFLAINGLTMTSVIRVGQTLNVSSSNSWHVVRTGQSACGIAENYRVSCSALLDANRLSRSSIIKVGQRLRIPSQG